MGVRAGQDPRDAWVGCNIAIAIVWLISLLFNVLIDGLPGDASFVALVAALLVIVVMVRRYVRLRGQAAPAPQVTTASVAPVPTGSRDEVASPRVLEALYAGHTCGVCGLGFPVGSDFEECPVCRQWYHEVCWTRSAGCVTEGCPNARSGGAWSPQGPAHNLGMCPFCQTSVQRGTPCVTCPRCGVPYHADCWETNGGCAVYGCTARFD